MFANDQFSKSIHATTRSRREKDAKNNYATITYNHKALAGVSVSPGDVNDGFKLPKSVNPKQRFERCLSAYNPKTKEMVVQFMPFTVDPLAVFTDQVKTTSTNVKTDYQTWMFDYMAQVESFLSYKLTPLAGCKRRIFAIHLEDTVNKIDCGDMNSWTIDTNQLLYLHIKYRIVSGKLDSIVIRNHRKPI